MISKAVNKYIRRTPRKVNTVLDVIRGKNVDYAFMLLKNINKGAKEEVSKTLKSAVSNAYEKYLFQKLIVLKVQYLKDTRQELWEEQQKDIKEQAI